MVGHVTRLATVLRRAGIDVATGDLIDATRALMLLDLLDRELVRSALRSVMISREPDLAVFDRAFDLVFAPGAVMPDQHGVEVGAEIATDRPTAVALSNDVGAAAARGDSDAMRALAARAVAMYGGDDAGDRLVIHRIMRALDLANMLSAVMRRLRAEGDLSEFELSLRRHEIARALEEFRRALADEIAKGRLAGSAGRASRNCPSARWTGRCSPCRAPNWPNCAGRCSRSPASWPPGWADAAGRARRAASIRAGRSAGHCRPAVSRSTPPCGGPIHTAPTSSCCATSRARSPSSPSSRSRSCTRSTTCSPACGASRSSVASPT